jgi:Flp pilus assembly pilin Flp
MQDLAIRAYLALEGLGDRLKERFEEEEGQTAAEYLGVIVVIAAIIAVLATQDIGNKLKDLILQAIDKVFSAGG